MEEFDRSGNIIHESGEMWDSDLGIWIPYHSISSTFNENNDLLSSQIYLEYDTIKHIFLDQRIVEYTYNADNQLEYIYSIRKDSREQPPLVSEYGEEYRHYCDGRFKESNFWNLTLNNRGGKTYTLYLDTPSCEFTLESDNIFTIIPNPAREVVHLSFRKELSDPVIRITAMNGRNYEVRYNNYNNLYSVDISGLPAGMYVVSVVATDNIYSVKFVKS